MGIHYTLRDDNGTIQLIADRIELKIDNNRKVYVRDKKHSSYFKHIDVEVPLGMTSEMKQKYLIGLHSAIIERLANSRQVKEEDDVEEEKKNISIDEKIEKKKGDELKKES